MEDEMTDATQLSLFGRPRKPAGPIRIAPRSGLDPVFFAVLVGAGIRPQLETIVATQRRNGVTAPLLPAETLHISLVGVGFYQHRTGHELGVAVATGDAIGFSPFEISLSTLSSHPRLSGKLPLVLTPGSATPLVDLARLLRWGMLERGFEPRSRPSDAFHLTLLYDAIPVDPTRLDRPLRVGIDGFALVRSVRGEGRYEVIGEWPRRNVG
jgi:2'-5' RNA ligase